MRDVGGPTGIAQSADERYKCEYSYQVLEPDGEREREHKDFLIAKQHGGGHENCIDSARGTNGGSQRNQMEDWAEGVSQNNSTKARANHAEKEELKKASAAPGNLKHGAKHPQHEHVEEQMKKTGVKKPVRQELIYMAMDNVMRPQRERTENGIGEISLAYCGEDQPK